MPKLAVIAALLVFLHVNGCNTDEPPAPAEETLADPPSNATTNPHAFNTVIPSPPPPAEEATPVVDPGDLEPDVTSEVGCSGSGGKVSVMPIGMADCKVFIGGTSLGVAPFFKKDSPIGKCTVEVKCPNGKSFKKVENIGRGSDRKIIVKPGDWMSPR